MLAIVCDAIDAIGMNRVVSAAAVDPVALAVTRVDVIVAGANGVARGRVCRLVAPRGQNRAKVLQALKDGPMTASEIAK